MSSAFPIPIQQTAKSLWTPHRIATASALAGRSVMEPGRRWIYNGGATALLARIIAKGTGKPLHDFARVALFDPLGIGATEWYTDRSGEAIAASGLRMTPRDLARIGLMMRKG